MATERPVAGGKRDMGVNAAVEYVAIHRENVGWSGGVLHELIGGREAAVLDRVNLIVSNRAHARQDHCIPYALFLRHALEAGEQVRVVFEAQEDNALELSGDCRDFRNGAAVRPFVFRRIYRPRDVSFRLLGASKRDG